MDRTPRFEDLLDQAFTISESRVGVCQRCEETTKVFDGRSLGLPEYSICFVCGCPGCNELSDMHTCEEGF